MMHLRNIAFTLVFFGGSLFHVVFSAAVGRFHPKAMLWIVRKWSLFHYGCVRHILGIDIRVEGTLPQEAALFAIKHESMFETIDIARLLDNPAVIAKKQLFSIPLWGRSALTYGMIPVDREGGSRALREMLALARKAVVANRPIVIFPEGTRVCHGERPALQSGFAGLYKMLKLPVVPVAVNSGKLAPRSNGLWHKGTITYRIGETIPPGLSRAEMEAQVHDAVNALNAPAG